MADLVWGRCLDCRNPDRNLPCTARHGKRSGSDSYRPYHRMPDAVSGGRDRRQGQKKCHGNRKNEFWTEGKHPFCCPECIAARWLDRIMIYDGALAADGVMHTADGSGAL